MRCDICGWEAWVLCMSLAILVDACPFFSDRKKTCCKCFIYAHIEYVCAYIKWANAITLPIINYIYGVKKPNNFFSPFILFITLFLKHIPIWIVCWLVLVVFLSTFYRCHSVFVWLDDRIYFSNGWLFSWIYLNFIINLYLYTHAHINILNTHTHTHMHTKIQMINGLKKWRIQ